MSIATWLGRPPKPIPHWVGGLMQDVDPGQVPIGTIADGENFVPMRSPRMATRGGSRVMLTLNDDGAPAEVSHVPLLVPLSPPGALAISWAAATDKHYATSLTADIAFSSGLESTSRVALPAAWNNTEAAADYGTRPVGALMFERLYLADARVDYSLRKTLLGILGSSPPVVSEPTFTFGSGPAAAPRPYAVEEFNSVLFMSGYGTEDSGDGDRPEYLRHSFLGRRPDAADGFDKDAWAIIGAVGERITALRKGRGLLLVAKANEFHRVTGSPRALAGWQFAIDTLHNTLGLGVINPSCLVYVEPYFYGLGRQGVFRSDGFNIESLMGPRERAWKEINKIENGWVAYHPERHSVLFGLHPAEAGSGRSATWPWLLWNWDIGRSVWAPDWKAGADFFYGTAIVTETQTGPIAPPTTPATTNVATGGWTAGWTNGDASAETEYWEKEGAAGTYILTSVEPPADASVAPTGRKNHTEYRWRVRHRKGGVHSDYTIEETVKTLIAAPIVISAVSGAPSTISVKVQNVAEGPTVLRLERKLATEPDGSYVERASKVLEGPVAATFFHDSVQCDVDYNYRARSTDAGWPTPESAYSNVVAGIAECEDEEFEE